MVLFTVHIYRRIRLGSSLNGAGFTLIEMLVVMGVITVIVGILLPALGGAREAARKAACGANLRSIGQGLSTYGANYGGAFPCAYSFNCNNYYPAPGITHWSAAIYGAGYSLENAFHCPDFPRGGLPPTDTTSDNLEAGQANNETSYVDSQARRCAYTLNEAICPQPFVLRDPPPGTPMGMCHYVGSVNVDLHTNRLYRSVHVGEVEAPADTILATEWQEDWRMVSGPSYFNASQTVSLSYRPVHGFAPVSGSVLDPFDVSLVLPNISGAAGLRELGVGDVAGHAIAPGWRQARLSWVGRNHDGGRTTNFAYVDSHVESKIIERTLAPFEWGRKFYSLCPGDDIAGAP